MSEARLSKGTEERIWLLFAATDRDVVRTLLLTRCGNNLFPGRNLNDLELERIRFAVLKLSDGDMEKLGSALQLAQQDWRDALMASDFGHDIHAHERWVPERHL